LTGTDDNAAKQDLTRRTGHGRTQLTKLTEKQRLEYLKHFLVGSAKEARTFFAAAMAAFFTTALISGEVWLAWALKVGRGDTTVDIIEDKQAYLRWCVPAIIAIFNFALASLCGMRLKLTDSYGETMQADAVTDSKGQDGHSDHEAEAEVTAKERRQQLLKRLANYMKLVNTVAFLLLGSTKAASELAALESSTATLLLIFIGITVCIFYLFIFVTFKRLASAIREWVMELPLWRMMHSLSKNDWVRAGVLCFVLPMSPLLLFLSLVNQWVRVSRGLYSHAMPLRKRFDKRFMPDETPLQADTKIVVEPVQDDQFLTARFVNAFRFMDEWDWISVYEKMTMIGVLLSMYSVTSKFLNVGLSFLISLLVDLPLAVLLVCAFMSGLICFLLPPVPGVPVYLFTGVLIATKHREIGFMTACIVAVALAFGLKLLACAIQQQVIGRSLGSSNMVRSLVGVQKPLIRAIETVLSRKGLSVAKVAIACGGPDWPTSVLAGLLRLSLAEMELATLPVIFFVAPCVLSGAFYIKRADGPIWEASGNLMLQITVVAAVLMQLVAAWAIQDVLDHQTFAVTKPLERNMDLDWLDYRRNQLAKASKSEYKQVPLPNRMILIISMLTEVMVSQLLFWQGGQCFGDFSVTDNINELTIWGTEDAFVKPAGAIGLGLVALGLLLFMLHLRLMKHKRAALFMERDEQLKHLKAKWLAYRKLLAIEVDMFQPRRQPPGINPMVPQE